MERLRLRELRALSNFLRELHAPRAPEEQRVFVASRLPDLIGSDITSYLSAHLKHPRIEWVVHPASAEKRTDRTVAARYLEQNPVVAHYRRTGDCRALRISDFITRRQLHRLPIYVEMFRREGIAYQLAVPVGWTANTFSRVALHRALRDFSDRERLILDLLRPHLLHAAANAEALALLQRSLEGPGRASLRVAADGKVSSIEATGRSLLERYLGAAPEPGERLPGALARWLAADEQLLDADGDAPAPPPPLVVEHAAGRLTVRAILGPSQKLLLLEEHRTSPDPARLEVLGLSRREAEVLSWIAEGKTNAVIGRILGLSPRTVEKHVENMLQKLGVETRTAAVVKALEVERTAGTN